MKKLSKIFSKILKVKHMKYSIQDSDYIQHKQDRILQWKDVIAQLQQMVTEDELELEAVLSHNRRGSHSILSTDSSGKLITGVRQFAMYIHKSPATAQKILNKGVLQENAVAYRVGNSWTINIERLDQLIAEDPQILRC